VNYFKKELIAENYANNNELEDEIRNTLNSWCGTHPSSVDEYIFYSRHCLITSHNAGQIFNSEYFEDISCDHEPYNFVYSIVVQDIIDEFFYRLNAKIYTDISEQRKRYYYQTIDSISKNIIKLNTTIFVTQEDTRSRNEQFGVDINCIIDNHLRTNVNMKSAWVLSDRISLFYSPNLSRVIRNNGASSFSELIYGIVCYDLLEKFARSHPNVISDEDYAYYNNGAQRPWSESEIAEINLRNKRAQESLERWERIETDIRVKKPGGR
jgi:hypothetical protein